MSTVTNIVTALLDSIIIEAFVPSITILALSFTVVSIYRKPVESYLNTLERRMAGVLKRRFGSKQENLISARLLTVIKQWGRLVHREYYYYFALKRAHQFAAVGAFFWTGAYVLKYIGLASQLYAPPKPIAGLYELTRPLVITSGSVGYLPPHIVFKILSLVAIFSSAFFMLTVVLKFGFEPEKEKPSDVLAPFDAGD